MLDASSIACLLVPYLGSAANDPALSVDPTLYERLTTYLELLRRWNARTNLTAIRDPEEMVRRHFGESLFLGRHVGDCTSLLDFGSGAGFPGVPVGLLRPNVTVTLAESQGKKAAFLREVVRELQLSVEVWPSRVASMPPERRFDVVAMRAVDRMAVAVKEGDVRARHRLLMLGSSREEPPISASWTVRTLSVPRSANGVLVIADRT